MTGAALADLASGGGWALLTAKDPAEREVRLALANRAAEVREMEGKRLAVWIANASNGKAPG